MSIEPLTDERVQEIVDLHKETGGNTAETARRAGKARSTIFSALKQAARKGLMGTSPVMPGFHIAAVSTLRREDGSVVHENIRQIPEREGKKRRAGLSVSPSFPPRPARRVEAQFYTLPSPL